MTNNQIINQNDTYNVENVIYKNWHASGGWSERTTIKEFIRRNVLVVV
jgi:hypothetical protein